MAEKGQSAVGLDYVWLDDVTAGDWTRYHALIKCASRLDSFSLSGFRY